MAEGYSVLDGLMAIASSLICKQSVFKVLSARLALYTLTQESLVSVVNIPAQHNLSGASRRIALDVASSLSCEITASLSHERDLKGVTPSYHHNVAIFKIPVRGIGDCI